MKWTVRLTCFALLSALGLVALACSGAEGDPAPTPSEAGVTTDPTACVDAGIG